MSAAWAVYVLAVSVLIAVGASALAAALRLVRRPTRGVWLAALVATVASGAMATGTRAAPIAPMPVANIGALITAVSAPAHQVPLGARLWLAVEGVRDRVNAALDLATRVSPSVDRAVAIAAFASTLIALLSLIALYMRFAIARRRWRSAEIDGVRVLVASDVGPAVIGAVRASIVVPEWLLMRPSDEQRIVVQHEHEHLRGFDAPALALGWVALALMPWNPIAWWMVRELRAAVELDCDARVLARSRVDARVYGTLLIDLAELGAGITPGAIALGLAPTQLERRLKAMRPLVRSFAVTRAIACVGLALAVGAAAVSLRAPAVHAQTPGIKAGPEAQQQRNEMKVAVRQVMVAQEAYYSAKGKYAATLGDLAMGEDTPKAPIKVRVHATDAHGYVVVAERPELPDEECRASLGSAAPSKDLDGVLVCGHVANVRINQFGGNDVLSIRNADNEKGGAQFTAIAGSSVPRDTGAFRGLIYVDGVKSDDAAMRKLDPKNIASVNVLKGDEALKQYGEAGRNGVIVITMKKP